MLSPTFSRKGEEHTMSRGMTYYVKLKAVWQSLLFVFLRKKNSNFEEFTFQSYTWAMRRNVVEVSGLIPITQRSSMHVEILRQGVSTFHINLKSSYHGRDQTRVLSLSNRMPWTRNHCNGYKACLNVLEHERSVRWELRLTRRPQSGCQSYCLPHHRINHKFPLFLLQGNAVWLKGTLKRSNK